MLASFLAHKSPQLHISYVIPVGIGAPVAGDNVGFWLGRRFGRKLIRWLKKILPVNDTDIASAKDLIRRRGWWAIFWARFLFGFRTVAGPAAGALGMEGKSFLQANIMGVFCWVTTIALIGYLFANALQNLLRYFETAGWAISAGLAGFGYFLSRHEKNSFEKRVRPAEGHT